MQKERSDNYHDEEFDISIQRLTKRYLSGKISKNEFELKKEEIIKNHTKKKIRKQEKHVNKGNEIVIGLTIPSVLIVFIIITYLSLIK